MYTCTLVWVGIVEQLWLGAFIANIRKWQLKRNNPLDENATYWMNVLTFWTNVSYYHSYVASLLHGLEPFYTTVEKCTGRSRVWAQDTVICGKGWYAGEDEKTIIYFIQVGVLWRIGFLSRALRLPKKLDLQRTPLLENVRHVGIHVIFSSMCNALHQRTLDRSVNHHRTRVLLSANQILEFP